MSGDYDSEPVPGLPQRLPPGEAILWQGAPDWRALARHALHIRGLAVYFAALALWCAGSAVLSGGFGVASLLPAALGSLALGLVALFAWAVARSTVYTITNRRVVVRFGVALPMTLNLPFTQIEGAEVALAADGSGDIALRLGVGQRLGYLVLWPHARPWRLARAEPTLRAIPNAAAVADLLAGAMAPLMTSPAPVLRARVRPREAAAA